MTNDALRKLAQSSGLRAGQLAQLMHTAPRTARRLLGGQNVRANTLIRFIASTRPTKPAWMGFRQQIIDGAGPKSSPLDDRQLELGI